MPVRRSAGDLVGVAGGARHRAAGGAIGEPLDDEAAQGRRQLGQPLELDRAARRPFRAIELSVDQGVEHLGLVAQQLGRAQHVARRRPGGPRPAPAPGRGGPGCARSRPHRCSGRRATQAALLAVGGRLLAGEAEQRPHQAAVAGRMPSRARRLGEEASR